MLERLGGIVGADGSPVQRLEVHLARHEVTHTWRVAELYQGGALPRLVTWFDTHLPALSLIGLYARSRATQPSPLRLQQPRLRHREGSDDHGVWKLRCSTEPASPGRDHQVVNNVSFPVHERSVCNSARDVMTTVAGARRVRARGRTCGAASVTHVYRAGERSSWA